MVAKIKTDNLLISCSVQKIKKNVKQLTQHIEVLRNSHYRYVKHYYQSIRLKDRILNKTII